MRRKTALVLSGMVTVFAMVAVIGLFGLSARQARIVQAAAVTRGESAVDVSQTGQLSTDVTTLQAEVVAYQQQLQEAYSALQQAYNEIQVLSANNGSRGFRDRGNSGQSQFNDGGVGDD